MPSPNLNPAVRESAPYGQACVGCSKAKCRCISRGPGNSCERCHRLNRDCHASAVVRKRLARRPVTKTARLEEKLDDLFTLLKAQTTASPAVSHHSSDGLNDPPSTGSETLLPGAAGDSLQQPDGAIPPVNANNAESGVSPAGTLPYLAHLSQPSASFSSQDDECLRTFQTHHLQALPFVYIPSRITAAQLQRERPFLWLNIQALCCKNTTERNKLDHNVRQILAQRLLVDGDRTLDLLLGLVAYLAWSMDHGKGKKMLCLYSNLASSLVFDLRLDRPGQENPCSETDSYKSFSHPIKQYIPIATRTNEERRVTLASFAVCSTISSFLKSQPMRWTPHMEDCVQHLANDPETPGDEVLAAIVKISKVMDDVNAANFGRLFESEIHGPSKVPPVLHVKALVVNLDAVKGALRPELLRNKVVKSYLCDTYAMINNIALHNTTYSTIPGLTQLGKTECFYACLEALKQGLDNWFSFTPEELYGTSMPLLLHFGRSTHILYRLAMAEDVAWDRAAARHAVDLIQTVERAAELLASVPHQVQMQSDGSDFFTKGAAALRNAVSTWKKAFADADAALNAGPGIQNGVELGAVDVAPNEFVMAEFSDDAWLTEMFTSWET
ncbi:hypothetical protein B0T10DRAFT_607829 [Thelonectria olida]|uniref:Zn(2)-C6 fungal-type domain-containing protein n=1 Tax=Thelonectria olida TaxID=1576542 RepID=A0A9P9AMV9_9HYPO|nr:hypothetical protein B0T10DRAFT_607829 [Thelonectria olida]